MNVEPWLNDILDPSNLLMEAPFFFDKALHSDTSTQTAQTFSYKWAQSATFERPEFRSNSGNWYIEKYGPLTDDAWWDARSGTPVVIEIGPGAGVSAEYLIGRRLPHVHYFGVDISTAIHEANRCLRSLGGNPWFLQADVLRAPLKPACADLVFSEGVLHHTDDTLSAVKVAASLVKPGGRLAFYVYRVKAPAREFLDDHIRGLVADLPPSEAWERLMPLSRLGKALGELQTEITVPETVDVLGIPAGTYDIQRLFYWFFFKAYYTPTLSLDEMNHINFDWYTPKNCHRHTPEEVQGWMRDLGFDVTWIRSEESGITIVADRR